MIEQLVTKLPEINDALLEKFSTEGIVEMNIDEKPDEGIIVKTLNFTSMDMLHVISYSQIIPTDFTLMIEHGLEDSLKDAVEREDYEEAAEIIKLKNTK
jgi:hypothetical protein